MRIPSPDECFEILMKHEVPLAIVHHCELVCDVAVKIADKLVKRGIKVDKDLVIAAALLHDIGKLKKEPHLRHGGELLRKLGLERIAQVVERHGLVEFGNDDFIPKTIEEKIVFYADKRANPGKIVGLEERFDYLKKKYSMSGHVDKEYEFTKKLEKELLEMIGEDEIC